MRISHSAIDPGRVAPTMLWILISLFFCWMFYREFRSRQVAEKGFDLPDSSPVNKTYLAITGTLALGFAYPPVHHWQFEHFLSAKATVLADGRHAKVHCNTMFDTFVDTNVFAAGHANGQTGDIVIQHPMCETLRDYLRHPERASWTEIFSLNVFTHESMHVRGEHNEARTECQAVQRNYRAAKLLGVPDKTARKNALDFYRDIYMQMRESGPMQRAYFSGECAPGKALDERLADSTWGRE